MAAKSNTIPRRTKSSKSAHDVPNDVISDDVIGRRTSHSAPASPDIEEPVKRAIRKKKYLIASELTLSQGDLLDMVKMQIITSDFILLLKGVDSNAEKVNRLVDFAVNEMDNEQVTAFLDFIRHRLGDHYDEIEAEIITESGLLIVEESVRNEASVAVHRFFGSSKRFSESDKRNMTDVLASKMQMTKLLWKSRMNTLQLENQAMKEKQKAWEKEMGELQSKIDSFLRRNEFGNFDLMMDMRSTTQALMNEEHEQDKLEKLSERTSFLIQKFARVLMERETDSKDMERSRTLLRIRDPQKPLFSAIQKYIKENDKKIHELEKELKSMKRKIIAMEEDINNKEVDMETDPEVHKSMEKCSQNISEETLMEVNNNKTIVKASAVVAIAKSKPTAIKPAIKTKSMKPKANVVF